mmetsp:Transcript_34193/g.58806  ORF Transcript_34193/g.58806 Transcript_34193/m.58806 type:complete len:97 (-) Transcript_34193:98-388(-)|eukprot:CAMPEP_0205926750 /NCGR_PEP_ID=MMETSP1325-20131115/21139_1 /ASSEMBLY_ACC=CAM_ASM_000708 /TAXON_ID=236786 /ORGANISM="Florenciella sp., Strain RCC1007" /LENGTH=96 /DNA_ID=CAMNT_0053295515 /DNA_START=106 /DNA_END=396 /DNA_ORIENTATION=+
MSGMAEQSRQQDDLLDGISQQLGGLHERAKQIHTESALHVPLMEELDVDVETTNEALKLETLHAEGIRKSSGVCWLYVAVIVLFGIMVMLIVLGLN